MQTTNKSLLMTAALAGWASMWTTPSHDAIEVKPQQRRPLVSIAGRLGRGSSNRYPVSVLRERGLAWAGDDVKPSETRQMRRHPHN
jgi:hypothetical protein